MRGIARHGYHQMIGGTGTACKRFLAVNTAFMLVYRTRAVPDTQNSFDRRIHHTENH